MNVTQVQNKRGYFFDGATLLVGFIGGGESVYCKRLVGRVLYSKLHLIDLSLWQVGYSYGNWDWTKFEFVPSSVFRGLNGYLSFIEGASIEEFKAYLVLKEIMKRERIRL